MEVEVSSCIFGEIKNGYQIEIYTHICTYNFESIDMITVPHGMWHNPKLEHYIMECQASVQ